MRVKSKWYTDRGGYYWTCEHCGANLDAGERCTCQDDPTTMPAMPISAAPAYKTQLEILKTELTDMKKKQYRRQLEYRAGYVRGYRDRTPMPPHARATKTDDFVRGFCQGRLDYQTGEPPEYK